MEACLIKRLRIQKDSILEGGLLSVFMDPTATPLRPNTFYISAISMGYGLTDRFMLKTKYGSSLNGDLNCMESSDYFIAKL